MPAFLFDGIMFAVTALPFTVVSTLPFRRDDGYGRMDMALARLLAAVLTGALAALARRFLPWAAAPVFLAAMFPCAALFAGMLSRPARTMRWCYPAGMVCSAAALLAARALSELVASPAEGAYFSVWYAAFAVPFGAAFSAAVLIGLKKYVPDSPEEGANLDWNGIWFMPVTLCILITVTDYAPPEWQRIVTALISVSACCHIYSVWGGLCDSLRRAGETKARDAELENVIGMQREQYAALTEQIEAARKARHDLRHHMNALWQYVESGDRELLREYLDEYGGTLPTNEPMSWCLNPAVNSVAQHYLGRAKAEGIDVDAVIALSDDDGVPAPDLCVVLGNSMENAVEAARSAPVGKRFIRVRVEETPGWIAVVIGNGYSGAPLVTTGGGFRSSKAEGRVGVGLSSIRNIAKKYGGDARFEAEKDMFKTSVLMFKQPVE